MTYFAHFRFEIGDKVTLKQTPAHTQYWNMRFCKSINEAIPHDAVYIVTEVGEDNGCICVNHIDEYIGSWRFESYKPDALPEELFEI